MFWFKTPTLELKLYSEKKSDQFRYCNLHAAVMYQLLVLDLSHFTFPLKIMNLFLHLQLQRQSHIKALPSQLQMNFSTRLTFYKIKCFQSSTKKVQAQKVQAHQKLRRIHQHGKRWFYLLSISNASTFTWIWGMSWEMLCMYSFYVLSIIAVS